MPMIFFLPRTLTRHILFIEESSFLPAFLFFFLEKTCGGERKELAIY